MKDKIVEILESEFGKGYDTSHSLNKYMYDIAEAIDALYSAGEQNKCHSCGEPMSNDCPRCTKLWES